MNTENNYIETDLGNVALNPRGEYDSSAAYEYLDAVSYQGGSYFCLAELETTITGIAPDPGHNSEHWQMIALPGDMTPEYIAAHDDVINKAKQVETSRAVVEQSQQEIESAHTDIQQLHSDTVQAAQEAENSRDSAAGYAQSAEQSRKVASESEQNINAQIAGFDEKVTESVTLAQTEIDKTRKQAIQTIISQQETSVKNVKSQTEDHIALKELEAQQGITEHTNQEIERFDVNIKTAKDNLNKTIADATAKDTTLKKTISDAANLNTEIGKSLEAVKTATTTAETAATNANTATKAAKDQAAAAKSATDALIAQTQHITLAINSEDGGLDIVYTE